MTMWQAAVKVLEVSSEPLALDEIYRDIIEQKLFEFTAADPKSSLRRQIHRHCQGVHDCKPGAEYFVRLPNKQYQLLESSR